MGDLRIHAASQTVQHLGVQGENGDPAPSIYRQDTLACSSSASSWFTDYVVTPLSKVYQFIVNLLCCCCGESSEELEKKESLKTLERLKGGFAGNPKDDVLTSWWKNTFSSLDEALKEKILLEDMRARIVSKKEAEIFVGELDAVNDRGNFIFAKVEVPKYLDRLMVALRA